ncbi:MAG: bifunctional hydroxymethylpyrimidine kinase/phosphomethylpyrimidine kinase [Bdellovibrionales bacterium]|nr:bifunctional hydroxymethylpyrimidine kinase/phosphomethylpyrimidine kinase [Bdellovibrionales bacterium]
MSTLFDSRSAVLSIAGYDPSGGAGVLADAKTFDSLRYVGCCLISSITGQSSDSAWSVRWEPIEEIEENVRRLAQRYAFRAVKIGLIEGSEMLRRIVALLLQVAPDAFIVWDPVSRSSSGFQFHDSWQWDPETFSRIAVVVPSVDDFDGFAGGEFGSSWEDCAHRMSCLAPVCVTGIRGGSFVKNVLFQGSEVLAEFQTPFLEKVFEKHGSGCVFSAAVAVHLANGLPLESALSEATEYVRCYLLSNSGLHGFHSHLR